MRVIRYMLIGRFWTVREFVPLYSALLLMGGAVVGFSLLSERFRLSYYVFMIVAALAGMAWIGIGLRLAIRRIRDIRAEEASGRYMP